MQVSGGHLKSIAILGRAILAGAAVFAWSTPAAGQRAPPWLVGELDLVHDDQPRTALHAHLEYGRFLGPYITLSLGLDAARVIADAPLALGAQGSSGESQTAPGPETTTLVPRLGGTLAIPALRLGLSASAGGLLGAPTGSGTAGTEVPILWETGANVRIGPSTFLQLEASQEHYTWTMASIDTLLLMQSFVVAVDRAAAPGWAGRLSLGLESFGDDNPIRSAYAWILAPLHRSESRSLRVGYSASYRHAERSNWVPAGGTHRGPGESSGLGPLGILSPDGSIPGQYAPYYTPQELSIHSAVVAVAQSMGSGWLKLDGAVGIHATEQAPVLWPTPAGPSQYQLQFHEHSFRPYRLEVSWSMPLAGSTSLTVGGDYNRTAFYGAGRVRLALSRSL
ncbi:MAG: hypothetical protein WEA09_14865 [Gemmatimonadota bacterium]